MRTCVSRVSVRLVASMASRRVEGETLRRARRHRRVHCRRCVERRRQTTRRPSAGPSAAARAGGRARGRARARRWSARARRRGRARLHDPRRRLHDPSPRAAPASSSADGGWLCLLAKRGMGGQPRRALLRRGRGATGESLAAITHAGARRAPRFCCVQQDLVRCDVPSARSSDRESFWKQASGEAWRDTFRYAWWRFDMGRVLGSILRLVFVLCGAAELSLVDFEPAADAPDTPATSPNVLASTEASAERTGEHCSQ